MKKPAAAQAKGVRFRVRQPRCFLAGVFLILSMAGDLRAQPSASRQFKDLVEEAALIARGRAQETYSDWGISGGARMLFTYTRLDVTEILKGARDETQIRIRQPGGVKEGVDLRMPGLATFEQGEDVVVLLGPRHTEDGSHDVAGLMAGKFNVIEKDGKLYLARGIGRKSADQIKSQINSVPAAVPGGSFFPYELFKIIARGKDHLIEVGQHQEQIGEAAKQTRLDPLGSPQAAQGGAPGFRGKGAWIISAIVALLVSAGVLLRRNSRKRILNKGSGSGN